MNSPLQALSRRLTHKAVALHGFQCLPRKRTLIIWVHNGLSNRIQALISGLKLAHDSDRVPILVWPNDEDCPCEFSELYESSLPCFSTLPILQIKDAFLTFGRTFRFVEGFIREQFTGVDLLSDPRPDIILLRSAIIAFDQSDQPMVREMLPLMSALQKVERTADGKYVAQWKSFRTEAESIQFRDGLIRVNELARRYIHEHLRGYLLELRPKRDIVDEVERFAQAHFDSHTVGVHIRRTDIAWTWAYLDTFLDVMRRLLSDNRKTNFFLCTDSVESERVIQETFGDRVSVYPKSFQSGKRRQTSVQAALIDQLLLSRSCRILKEVYSTFGLIASCYRGAPMTTVFHP